MNYQDLLTAAENDPESIIKGSFKNFHAKGLDYLCLHRSPTRTVKLYLLDGDASKLPEVVNPHDHRYNFRTTVLAGEMVDYRFAADPAGDVWNAFDYMTPLNGGDGFTFRGEERMSSEKQSVLLRKGDVFETSNLHTHTIRMREDQTVLMLDQFEDIIDVSEPTSCWSRKGDPVPELQPGCYDRFTADDILDRIGKIKALI